MHNLEEYDAPKKDDYTGKKLVYDFYFHESDRISERTDWFLIFHAIMFQSYFGSLDKQVFMYKMLASLIGVMISYLWLMNGIRTWYLFWHLGKHMVDKELMGEMADMHIKIIRERKSTIDKKWYGWAKPSPSFSILIPTIFFIVWCAIFFTSANMHWAIMAIIILIAMALFVYAISTFGEKHIINKKS